MSQVLAVIGAQYGSEGKGVIVHHLANRYDVHVRVGGPNAGHTFVHDGITYRQRQLPCGWTNPKALLMIGAGAVVDLERLVLEVQATPEPQAVWDRLHIDGGAFALEATHRREEGGTAGALHHQIGSTGEGVGAARIARIRRDSYRARLVRDACDTYGVPRSRVFDNLAESIHSFRQEGRWILLEGTQGAGLSLWHGPWPYVTSHDTGAAQLAADVGVPPQDLEVLAVARTYPIRVAGHSGPLFAETDWRTLSQRVGRPVIEHTTVTNKVRRVGEWDMPLIRQCVVRNRPHRWAITFMDYAFPGLEGMTQEIWDANTGSDLLRAAHEWLAFLDHELGARVSLLGVGGPGFGVIER